MKIINILFIIYILINQCNCDSLFKYRILSCTGNSFLNNDDNKSDKDNPFIKIYGNFGNTTTTTNNIGSYIFNPKFCNCYSESNSCHVIFKNFINDKDTKVNDKNINEIIKKNEKFNITLIAEFEIINTENIKNIGDITNKIKNNKNCENFEPNFTRDRFYFGNLYRNNTENVFQGEIGYSSLEYMVDNNITFPYYFEPLKPQNCKENLEVGNFRINYVKECININETSSDYHEKFYKRKGFNGKEPNCNLQYDFIYNNYGIPLISKFNKTLLFIAISILIRILYILIFSLKYI